MHFQACTAAKCCFVVYVCFVTSGQWERSDHRKWHCKCDIYQNRKYINPLILCMFNNMRLGTTYMYASLGDQINKLWHIHTKTDFVAIFLNEVYLYVLMWNGCQMLTFK